MESPDRFAFEMAGTSSFRSLYLQGVRGAVVLLAESEKYQMEDRVRMGMERISSAPRLSFSSQDVFNLRNHKLSQLSSSSPGIYSSQKKGLDSMNQQVSLRSETSTPRSILIKSNEASPEPSQEEEKEEKKLYSIRFELQFTAFVFLCFTFVVVIPISMVAIGSVFIYSCPAEVMIPVFLVVGGSAFLFSVVLLRKLSRMAKQSESDEICYKKSFMVALIGQLGWFVAGCYWIYGAYEPDYYNEDNSQYCHKTLYQFSFWLLNSIFLTLSLFAVLFSVYIVFGREQAHDIGTKV